MTAPTFGILGQSKPPATVLTNIYTVPLARRASIKVIAANQGAAADSFRVAHALAGAADATKQYLVFDVAVDVAASKGTDRITMNAGDILRVRSANGDISFNINGIEEDA